MKHDGTDAFMIGLCIVGGLILIAFFTAMVHTETGAGIGMSILLLIAIFGIGVAALILLCLLSLIIGYGYLETRELLKEKHD